MKKKVLIIDSNYPNENNLYGDVFVHARARHYVKEFNVQVLGWDQGKETFQFIYEGIPVKSFNTKEELTQNIFRYNPDIVLIHFVEGWMLEGFIKVLACPVIIWVHGAEALGWYRRIFNLSNFKQFAGYVLRNTNQMLKVRKLIAFSNNSNRISFVFVSKWMKKITETDAQIRVKKFYIIPNPIDHSIFNYSEKNSDHRKKVLLIRSFDSKKYANDIAVEAILELSKRKVFFDLEFSIYGKGKYFDPLVSKVKEFRNVKVYNQFIENKAIPAVHKEHGIFLCPTRQDAQGVSMCEAMSGGLVPISSNNTAIPEFLDDNTTGFVTDSPVEIADKIELLYHNPEKFLLMSEQASKGIQEISGTDYVINKEIFIIKEKATQIDI